MTERNKDGTNPEILVKEETMCDYETVKYNHPSDTNVWFIDIKGNEPIWAVNIQQCYEKDKQND